VADYQDDYLFSGNNAVAAITADSPIIEANQWNEVSSWLTSPDAETPHFKTPRGDGMLLRSANRSSSSNRYLSLSASASKRKYPEFGLRQSQELEFGSDCDSSLEDGNDSYLSVQNSGAADSSVDNSHVSTGNVNVSLLGQMNLSASSDHSADTTAASNISFSPSMDYGIASSRRRSSSSVNSSHKPPLKKMDSPCYDAASLFDDQKGDMPAPIKDFRRNTPLAPKSSQSAGSATNSRLEFMKSLSWRVNLIVYFH
jgi:hypothetical protein